jgi:hypothetical protein
MKRSFNLTLTILLVVGGHAFGQESSDFSESRPALYEDLGTIQVLGPGNCSDLDVEGYSSCQRIEVDGCPSGDNVKATVAVDDPPNPLNGMVSLFSGETGAHWWGTGNLPGGGGDFILSLRAAGYRTAQVKWSVIPNETKDDGFDNSWLESRSQVLAEVGPQRMACRPATVIKYLWDEVYQPMLEAGRITGTGCGFCLSGNSGGASQIAYSIVHYGLLDVHNVLIGGLFPTSGPIHTNLELACSGPAEWLLSPSGRIKVDASYRWELEENTGRCRSESDEQGWLDIWTMDSIEDLAGGLYAYPDTRVEMILGGADQPLIWRHACEFFNRIDEPPTAKKALRVPGMEHRIQDSEAGLERLYEAIVSGLSKEASCTP